MVYNVRTIHEEQNSTFVFTIRKTPNFYPMQRAFLFQNDEYYGSLSIGWPSDKDRNIWQVAIGMFYEGRLPKPKMLIVDQEIEGWWSPRLDAHLIERSEMSEIDKWEIERVRSAIAAAV